MYVYFSVPEGPLLIVVLFSPGLDASGKTSLLYGLKVGQIVQTIPTVGFNVETVTTANGVNITCWDLGGQEKVRPLYRHYYPNTHGYVYVVDSSDSERLIQALEELVQYILLEDLTRNTVVMVLANKQDLPGALSAVEVEQALRGMYNFSVRSPGRGHTVFVRPCSIMTMEGVQEAFEDFTEELRLKHAGRSISGLLSLEIDMEDEATVQAEEVSILEEVCEKNVNGDTSCHKQAELYSHKGAKNPIVLFKSFFQ
ncbi:ADP-ribosylation factor [Elysia marginata]|uniref:ADP-ribosylation factor n=1 Tax=Elysia marginata TaxID=1093978 RepID=A0AAV4HF66_9GAST|nr:ADP-ribosylation factor [Elysia marginata]